MPLNTTRLIEKINNETDRQHKLSDIYERKVHEICPTAEICLFPSFYETKLNFGVLNKSCKRKLIIASISDSHCVWELWKLAYITLQKQIIDNLLS